MAKLLFGVGLNDRTFPTYDLVNGLRVMNPFYRKWAAMLERCYSTYDNEKHRTYQDCYVTKEWLTLSKFRMWMESKDWQGNELDKDLLIPGNKVYSPETCIFVSHTVNVFVIDCGHARGGSMIGTSFHRPTNKFNAKCRNPFTGKRESLGYYKLEIDAHNAWKKRKHELACQLADIQEDDRLKAALRARYA